MYSTILVPLDGSALSERILPYARSFANAFRSPVELMHVIIPETIDTLIDVDHGRFHDVVKSDLMKTSREYLERVARSFPDPSRVKSVVEVGEAAEAIIDRLERDSGALLAMSTRGYSGLKRWFLGSVANKVLRATKNPLLLVKATDKVPDGEAFLTRILVPLDGSTLSENLLPHVVAISKALDLQIELLQAYTPPLTAFVPLDYRLPPQDFPNSTVGRALRERAEAYLKDKSAQLLAAGVRDVSYTIIEGDPAERIIETAQNTQHNLVAMCTHGRSGVNRWMLGSVTERVVIHSEDPVLVIPASFASKNSGR
jgi:nucleotide-binding universal stress UspA family protein